MKEDRKVKEMEAWEGEKMGKESRKGGKIRDGKTGAPRQGWPGQSP
jgi:hypothetical protein